jgi:hypothetical protein
MVSILLSHPPKPLYNRTIIPSETAGKLISGQGEAELLYGMVHIRVTVRQALGEDLPLFCGSFFQALHFLT